jgi:nucleoside-diphosphate-sugar epimerase
MPQPPRGVRPAGSGAGLTVAVTGPTGEIGKPFVQALERTRDVKRILGMARRPFDPKANGWRKTEYRQGDITNRDDVDALVKDADVVVHLAFIVLGASDATRDINLEGSRNVFRASVDAGVKRLVYTSSVAAYGFHEDNPLPLDEEVPTRGTEAHPYSAQKAELETVLHEETDGKVDTYVFRPCIVAGPQARMLIDAIPYVKLGEKLPGVIRALFDQVPVLKPVIPDPGVPFQLVHHDDVAGALKAAVLGKGEPGVYNLAADGEITMSDLADALHWYSVPVPDLAVDATAEIVSRIPFLPAEATWVNAGRVPVVMSTEKARKQLRWKPKHDTRSTLQQTVESSRADLQAGADEDA